LDHAQEILSVGDQCHAFVEVFWQVDALSLVCEARGTADGHDHPPSRSGSFDEEVPRVPSADVVSHHGVAIEVDDCRAVAVLNAQEGVLMLLLTHYERIEYLTHLVAATGLRVSVSEPPEKDIE